MKSGLNLERLITPITIFDACISDPFNLQFESGRKYGKIIAELIKDERANIRTEFAEYVWSSFQCFVANKTELNIHIGELVENVTDKQLLDMILYETEQRRWEPFNYGFKRREETDCTNLIKPQLLKLFKNVKTVCLWMSNFKGNICWTVSLLALLNIIKSSAVEYLRIIEFKEKTIKSNPTSWLYVLWKKHSNEIINRYKDENFEIQYEEKNKFMQYESDEIIIKRNSKSENN